MKNIQQDRLIMAIFEMA